MNIYLLPASALPVYVNEEPVASMDLTMVAATISRRDDFKSAKINKLLPSLF